MKTAQQTALLAPFEIWEVPIEKSTIKFHKPLVLTPEWLPDDPDEPSGEDFLSVEFPELGISAFGADRDELQRCIYGDICFAWRHYVHAADEKLSTGAKMIKQNYLALAEEVNEFTLFDHEFLNARNIGIDVKFLGVLS